MCLVADTLRAHFTNSECILKEIKSENWSSYQHGKKNRTSTPNGKGENRFCC